MDVGAEIFGMVKTDKKGLCKDTIYNPTKDWLGGSYLVLKINYLVPGDMPMISISYKYNAQKVLSWIATKDAGRRKSGITYLFKYPDPSSNVSIRPVDCKLFMYKFFGSVNDIDSPKKSGSLI